MTYDIFSNTAPAMPKPSKGTEVCKLLLSQASKDMREPLVPMAFPALSAHVSDAKFMYCDNKYYELCGQMGHLIGPSGIGKAQLTHLIEAIMRLFRDHDKVEYERLPTSLMMTSATSAASFLSLPIMMAWAQEVQKLNSHCDFSYRESI